VSTECGFGDGIDHGGSGRCLQEDAFRCDDVVSILRRIQFLYIQALIQAEIRTAELSFEMANGETKQQQALREEEARKRAASQGAQKKQNSGEQAKVEHSSRLKEYVKQSHWAEPWSPITAGVNS